MFERYQKLADAALAGVAPSDEDAAWILEGEDVALLPLLQAAFVAREHHFGRKVQVHVLNNIQNGLCPEDCGYCSQSRQSKAKIRQYPMKAEADILAEAAAAAEAGASRYCMVMSMRGPSIAQAEELAGIVRKVKERHPIQVCLSVGLLGDEHAKILAEAGLDRLNHNLNTSEERYGEICSTHTFQDRIDTITAAQRAGIGACSGLIVGMGESTDEIIEVAQRLRALEVPSIPVNFLIPIEGNPVLSDGSLTPEHCLRVLSLMRLVNPSAEVRIAAGREGHLRAMGPLCLYPANSLFVDGYLTTRGDDETDTYRMIRDAGFEVEGNPQWSGQEGAPHGDAAEFRLRGGDGEILKPEISRPEGRGLDR